MYRILTFFGQRETRCSHVRAASRRNVRRLPEINLTSGRRRLRKTSALLNDPKERTMTGWKSWEEARALSKDRDKWKKSSAALCATEREEDR